MEGTHKDHPSAAPRVLGSAQEEEKGISEEQESSPTFWLGNGVGSWEQEGVGVVLPAGIPTG